MASGEPGGTAASGRGRRKDGVREGQVKGPGLAATPSRSYTWNTLRMRKDEEEMSFGGGPHLSGTEEGDFRDRSNAALGVCCYGNFYLTQGG